MKKSFKVLCLLLAAFTLILVSACSNNNNNNASNSKAKSENNTASNEKAEKKLLIGLTVQNLSNPFFVAMSRGAQDYAKKNNAEVITQSADGDLAKQTSQIEDFITKEVDLILVNAVDSKGIAGAVSEAKAAGIPIIAVDVGADGGVNSVVSSDNFLAGKLAGEYIVKRLNGKGSVAVLDGPPVSAVTDRIAGFEEAIKGTDVKVVAKQNGNGNRETSLTMMETILQAKGKGEIDAVFAINDPSGVGAKIAAEQAGRDGEMFIVGVDGAPDAVTALKEKKSFAASSAQHPFDMIQKAIEVGLKVVKGDKVEPVIKVQVDLVTQENVDSYKGW